MTCREALGRLTAYLDGELDGATASAVRGHLRVCAECRTCASDHATIRDRLAGLDRPEPPPAMWSGVLAQLGAAEIADGRRSRWARLVDRLRPHLAPAGIAIGACAAAAMIIHQRQAPSAPAVRRAPIVAAAAPSPEAHDAAPVPPPPVRIDATAELNDEAGRIDARYRKVAADLLVQARGDLGDGKTRRRFERDVAALEREVMAAVDGKPRDRAWHQLLKFLERAALGERIAAVRP